MMKISRYEKLKHSIRFWLLRHLPTCKQTVAVISESMERALSVRERVLLKLHVWVCMWCQWYLEHLQIIRTSLREQAEQIPESSLASTPGLSDEARERLKRKLSGS